MLSRRLRYLCLLLSHQILTNSTMINGTEYAWEDISINMHGKVINGITDIKYSASKEHLNIYGKGDEPIAIGRGKKSYEASMTLLQSEIEALQTELDNGDDLTDIPPFEVTVSYQVAPGGALVTDILQYVRIGSYEKGSAEGSTHTPVSLSLVVGKIGFNS